MNIFDQGVRGLSFVFSRYTLEDILADEEKVEREKEIMDMLRDNIVDHQPPFTLLGGCRTGVKFKFQRVSWSLRLEFHSHKQLAQCYKDMVVVLKDSGTERALQRVKPIAASCVLPHFDRRPRNQAHQAQQQHHEPHGEDEWPAGDAPSDSNSGSEAEDMLDLGGSMGVDGPSTCCTQQPKTWVSR